MSVSTHRKMFRRTQTKRFVSALHWRAGTQVTDLLTGHLLQCKFSSYNTCRVLNNRKKKAITGVSFIGEFCQTFRNQHNLNSITAQKKWEKNFNPC